MRRFFKFFICATFIVGIAFGIYSYSNKYSLNIEKHEVKSEVLIKGCKEGISICEGEEGIYIAFYDEIIKIDSRNNISKVYKDVNLHIDDILYKEGNLYVLSMKNLFRINPSKGEVESIIENLPYEGENIDRNLLFKDNNILISIGAATNSGIAKNGGEKDITPINIELNGINFNNTGFLKDYGENSKNGEKINGEKIGNASIISINIESYECKLFASGVRNIKGYDLNSKNEVIAIVGGMENEGERKVERDSDYIYNIKRGLWYGWPDYSGGDPINSPRFTKGELIKPLIKNHPEKKVDSPIYQHNKINSLKGLAVDKSGEILNKDSIIFYDEIENSLYELNNKSVLEKILTFDKESKIEDIITTKDKCLVLDSGKGFIYSLTKNKKIVGERVPYEAVIAILSIALVTFLIIINKIKNKKIN